MRIHQVGTGVSFTSGQAAFTDLNYDLPTGYSYLWITYDIKSDAGHRDIVDAKLPANSININGQTLLYSGKITGRVPDDSSDPTFR